MKRIAAAALVASSVPGIVAAHDRPSLLDLFSIDIIAQRIIQSGVMALRTQMDMVYSDMSVDFLTGKITITDLQAWPLPDWDDEGTCEVSVDRFTVRGGALDEPDNIRLKIQLLGTSFPPSCLPREPREAIAMAQLEEVVIPRITLDIDYGLPASDAKMRLYADVSSVGVVDASADFAYIWMDGRDDIEEPLPVMFLDHASVAIENRGIFEALQPMIPEPFKGPGSGLVIEGGLGQELLRANPGPTDEAVLTDAQTAFLKSIATAWPAFQENPNTLVLETGNTSDVFLDFEAMDRDARIVFDDLMPTVKLAPGTRADILPVSLYQAAQGGDSSLSPEDTKRLGIALFTGVGVPMDREAGFDLLGEVAKNGDGEAAMVVAEGSESLRPEIAYTFALMAGRAGETGATALLDRLEKELPFARVLGLQAQMSGEDVHASASLDSVASIRDEAAKRFSGRGQARSYEIAAMWAMIGSAAGDAESQDILADIEERARLSGDAAVDAWLDAAKRASEVATDVWIGQNLPARFGQ